MSGSAADLLNPMNASSWVISQRKIALLVLFFDLTSSASYGGRTS
jgi:hypothetical protein